MEDEMKTQGNVEGAGTMLSKIVEEIADENALEERLKELSIAPGGAWCYSILPFAHTTTFAQFKSPSRVPDYMHDHARNRIGWKGEIVPFTKAARIREQNRGLGCQ